MSIRLIKGGDRRKLPEAIVQDFVSGAAFIVICLGLPFIVAVLS